MHRSRTSTRASSRTAGGAGRGPRRRPPPHRPTLQQAVGEAARRRPGVQGPHAGTSSPNRSNAGVELLPAAPHEARRRPQELDGSPGATRWEGLPAIAPQTVTRWSAMAACATARLGARPRRTSSGSRRRRAVTGPLGAQRRREPASCVQPLLRRVPGVPGASQRRGQRVLAFLAVAFLAAVFLAVDFLAGRLLGRRLLGGRLLGRRLLGRRLLRRRLLGRRLLRRRLPRRRLLGVGRLPPRSPCRPTSRRRAQMPTRAASSSTRASRSDRSTPMVSSCLVTSRWTRRTRFSVFSRPRATSSCTVDCASSIRSCPSSCRSFTISSALAWVIWVKLTPGVDEALEQVVGGHLHQPTGSAAATRPERTPTSPAAVPQPVTCPRAAVDRRGERDRARRRPAADRPRPSAG